MFVAAALHAHYKPQTLLARPLLFPQCSACCSELPPLPSETLADLQQEEAELNDDGAEEVSHLLTICKPLGGIAWGAAVAGMGCIKTATTGLG